MEVLKKESESGSIGLDNIRMMGNNVLCKVEFKNRDYKTAGGIYLYDDIYTKDQYEFNKVDRVYRVAKVPKRVKGDSWVTEMELLPGDVVWVSSQQAANCQKHWIDGEEYVFVNYFDIKVAKREVHNFDYSEYEKFKDKYIKDDREEKVYEVVPVNGHVVCEAVVDHVKLGFYEADKLDPKKAVVRYVGKPNKGYWSYDKVNRRKVLLDSDGGVEVKPGDLVLKDEQIHPPLEAGVFLRFNKRKEYITLQRKYIKAILE